MGAQDHVAPVRGGTGTASLAPPWSREQVRWLGKGYFILRLATEGTSRWLLGAGFRWNDVYPHERTFRRSATDKSALIQSLKMNPWPVHLASEADPLAWREGLAAAVEGLTTEYDTGHVTLWRLERLPAGAVPLGRFTVLDGHHSRRAQRMLGLPRVFGWVEPLLSSTLNVRSIERAGWLAKWIDEAVARGELRECQAPDPAKWSMESSQCFEVVQSERRWWCEIVKPERGARPKDDECAIDALTRLSKGHAFLRSSANFEEILDWLKRFEVDTGIRLPPPSKGHIQKRSFARNIFPQKTTYFHPKVPFGILVEDLV